MALQNKAEETLGRIAAIQTLCEKFPMAFKLNYAEFSTSFDFMIDILKMLGVDNRELVQKFANLFADDSEGSWLDILEGVIKTTLKLNMSKLLSCEVNPIIPDSMIGPCKETNDPNSFLQVFKNEQYGTNVPHGGFDLDVSLIDVMGYLRHSPLSEEGKYLYADSDYTVNELYRSTDFNTFLWYVINKSVNAPEKERKKSIWDNRYNVGLASKNDDYRDRWFADGDDEEIKKDKIKIMDVTYRDNGTSVTNTINIKINPEEYYRKHKITENFSINKTIFEFNNDYLNSLKLFSSKVILTSLVDTFTNSLNVSVGYSINEQMIMAQVDKIIKNVIEADDTEVDDCFFSFSNDEFNDMLEQTEMKMMGVVPMKGEYNFNYIYDKESLLSSLDSISSAATLEEKTGLIENLFFDISATPAKEGGITSTDALTFGYDTGLLSALLRAIIYPIVRVIFSPKVIMMLQINAHIMGKDFPSFQNFIWGMLSIIKNLIRQIKDMVLDVIWDFLISKLKPLLTLFTSKLFLEMISEYRALLEVMLDCITIFKTNKVLTTIDDVNYADIIPVETTPEDKKC